MAVYRVKLSHSLPQLAHTTGDRWRRGPVAGLSHSARSWMRQQSSAKSPVRAACVRAASVRAALWLHQRLPRHKDALVLPQGARSGLPGSKLTSPARPGPQGPGSTEGAAGWEMPYASAVGHASGNAAARLGGTGRTVEPVRWPHCPTQDPRLSACTCTSVAGTWHCNRLLLHATFINNMMYHHLDALMQPRTSPGQTLRRA